MAALTVTVTHAQAADAIVAAEPEPMEYVRVCDAYGEGYFYIPGSETCLKIGGYVRSDSTFGENAYTGEDVGYDGFLRSVLTFDVRNETELGTLRSFVELRNEASPSASYINSAYIEIVGFRVGLSDSQFDLWLNSAGNIINDDVIDYTGDRTNQINYTYKAENGFSFFVGLDQGNGTYQLEDGRTRSYKGGDVPHYIGGVKYEQGWGSIGAVGGYDNYADSFAGKARVDIKFTEAFTIFVMGGYQSDWNDGRGRRNYFGAWNGDWAAWGGFSAELTEKAGLNGQLAYEEDGTLAAALNVEYKPVDGLTIMPELNYTNFGGLRGNDEAFGGTLRVQRDF